MGQGKRTGRYEIERVLGRGATGVVYLARDPLIDRKVALKTLRTDLDEEDAEETRERFLREARAAGRLSHPNIATIYDVGEDPDSGTAFIAMEYLEGATLKEIMESEAPLEALRAAELGAVLAGALDSAQRQGVVHRDVKPANIILTADGTAKITDFGIARLEASELTLEGSLLGTPFYMSPEQMRGRPVDGRSDLYSLGVILFELVTGSRPFTGASLPELSLNIIQQPVPDPATLCPGIPESLSAVIRRCLAKEPGDRFQSGRELARALAELDPSQSIAPGSGRSRAAAEPPPRPTARLAEELTHQLTPPPMPPPVPTGGAEPAPASPPRLTGVEDTATGGGPTPAPLIPRRHLPWLWGALAGLLLLVGVAVATRVTPRAVEGPPPEELSDSAPYEEVSPPQWSPPADQEQEARPPADSDAPATLAISYKNRIKASHITVWIDDETVWATTLSSFGVVKRVSGDEVRESFPVAPGRHRITVRIRGISKSLDVRRYTEVDFEAGEMRHLKIILNPVTKNMKLSWTG